MITQWIDSRMVRRASPRAAIFGSILVVALSGAMAKAKDVERTCAGEFTDMRVIGLTLGDCDLSYISDKDLNKVKDVCGEPWTVDASTSTPRCSIR
jgi:hypothetical protein